jgi:hypothetical protein
MQSITVGRILYINKIFGSTLFKCINLLLFCFHNSWRNLKTGKHSKQFRKQGQHGQGRDNENSLWAPSIMGSVSRLILFIKLCMSCGHNTNSHDILYIVGSGCYNMYIWVVIHLLLPSMGILTVICPYSACVTFRLKVVNFSTRAVQTPAPARNF